jgi:hypothetical protein
LGRRESGDGLSRRRDFPESRRLGLVNFRWGWAVSVFLKHPAGKVLDFRHPVKPMHAPQTSAVSSDQQTGSVRLSGGRLRARRRVFLGVAAFAMAGFHGLCLTAFWLAYPRLVGAHPLLADGLAVGILVVSGVLFTAVGVVATSLKFKRCWKASDWMAARLGQAAPLFRWVASCLRVDAQEFEGSLIRVQRDLSRERRRRHSSGRLLCLVSQELPVRVRRNLRNLCAEWDTEFREWSPWTDTGALVRELRPSGVLLVGCETASLPLTADIGYEVPVGLVEMPGGGEEGLVDLDSIQHGLAQLRSGVPWSPGTIHAGPKSGQ